VTDGEWGFPEFGEGGDHIGARRSRRAFRRCVAFCVFFVAVLWVSEWFLRYDHADRLYLSALTKPHADSSRSILRQAVIHDERARERPSTRYLQALAAREEPDKVLETYEKAYILDPGNAPLAIRYGSQLHKRGQSAEAAELFSDASDKAPDNALPRYLHAAVMPWTSEEGDLSLSSSFTHIARTNSGGRNVQFPRPLWFGGLPNDGYWYAHLQRGIVDEACAPLFQFVGLVQARAAADIEEGNQRNWGSWLEHLDAMGGRFVHVDGLAADAEVAPRPGSIAHVYAGLQIQRAASALKNDFSKARGDAADEVEIKRIASIDLAIGEIERFEALRRDQIETERAKFTYPLVMCAWTFTILFVFFFAGLLAVRIVARNKAAGTIPHSTMGRVVLVIGPGLIFVLLTVVAIMQHRPGAEAGWVAAVGYVWWILLGLYVVFGLAYPLLCLPSATEAVNRRKLGDGSEADMMTKAKRARRAAYCTLLRRYYGIAIGFNLCFVCLWVVLYRVVYSLYPWQFELLILDPVGLELDLVARVLAMVQ